MWRTRLDCQCTSKSVPYHTCVDFGLLGCCMMWVFCLYISSSETCYTAKRAPCAAAQKIVTETHTAMETLNPLYISTYFPHTKCRPSHSILCRYRRSSRYIAILCSKKLKKICKALLPILILNYNLLKIPTYPLLFSAGNQSRALHFQK